MERVDRITTPLLKGEYYWVPTVHGRWRGQVANWPVIGPLHNDVEYFNHEWKHYHVDARFVRLSPELRLSTFRSPLTAQPYYDPKVLLPAPVFRRRKCHWPSIEYPHGAHERIQRLRKDFAGTQCHHGKGGWICPHQKASLGSITPIDGVITCPLHGLRIDAATGKVLP